MDDTRALRSQLKANLTGILERVRQACARVNRQPEDVRLVAVTKYAAWSWVEALVAECGVVDLAENRPQQLLDRAARMETPVTWHLIGHLQSNKAKKVLPVAAWIHSIDSFKLLTAVDRLAAELQVRPRVLLEVNVSGEASKDGFDPDTLRTDPGPLLACSHIELCGLMTMAPASDLPEEARPTFRGLRLLRDELEARANGALRLPELSMGMTGDFEVAIEEGATLIRIGSALFAGLE